MILFDLVFSVLALSTFVLVVDYVFLDGVLSSKLKDFLERKL